MRRIGPALLVVLTLASPAVGCLWDYDTLRDEKRGLPGVAEVLAGQWERHSAFFYRHRVDAMRAKLTTHPDDWDAMDNLAVAYEKLDDRDAAIAVMLDKERRHPGQYTTVANLGTFYIHKGDLNDGIRCLRRALAINPDAHFGREEYQVQLAEFLRQARAVPWLEDYSFLHIGLGDLGTLQQQATTQPDDAQATAQVLASVGIERDRQAGRVVDWKDLELKPNVISGLIGMVRFGTGTSPELYYALGDVLAARNDKALALRAYQRALEFHHPRPDAVRKAIEQVQSMVKSTGGLDPALIAAERAAADRWVADYQQFEDDLIRAGRDTDDEANYAPFYATHRRTLSTPDLFLRDVWDRDGQTALLVAGVAVAVLAAVGLELRRNHVARRRRRRPVQSPAG